MSVAELYPASPKDVPESLTQAKSSYRRQATLAFMGLLAFMVIYLLLTAGFGYITFKNVVALSESGDLNIAQILVVFCAGLLTLFMVKSLFAIRKMGTPDGIEVSPEDQPELYNYLHKLADEVGAPRPHRVFLTPEVNAAVFYDLSLINLIIPSKKNLIVGLGLVNVLNLSEFKAVLAHEFGHFSQNTMMVGRWVYIAQQIISHLVSVRDWLDGVVSFISRIDLRVAWIGWILKIVLWSLRSLMEVLFRIVIIAERALSREMEFNADLVAVSVTGSDELVNALYKLQAADQAWRTAMSVAGQAAGKNKIITDLFEAQSQSIAEMRRIYDDPDYGVPPLASGDVSAHRVFEAQNALPPQMWSTHPPSSDREMNAKALYVKGTKDERSAWLIFRQPEKLRETLSRGIYNAEKTKGFEAASSAEFVAQRFNNVSFSPEFRGAYLGRSPVRDFKSVASMMSMATIGGSIDPDNLYPESINQDIKTVNGFSQEIATLEALMSGDLKPSGGVIRHRGEDIRKDEIPEHIEQVKEDKKHALEKLMVHEADCRKTALNIAEKFQKGWPEYLGYTVNLLHAADHMLAVVSNEKSRLINTWNVIVADGSIGHFERRRMLRVCDETNAIMRNVSGHIRSITLSPKILAEIGIKDWQEAVSEFNFPQADKKNFPQWVQAAYDMMDHYEHALNALYVELLEDLLDSETALKAHFKSGSQPEAAPEAGQVPADYPILLDGDEYVLQKKLDLWNRFQLAHGVLPSIFRTLISLGIVGGTLFAGIAALNS